MEERKTGPIKTDNLTPMILKSYRRERGWSQQDLAQAVGVSVGTIYKFEAGRTRRLSRLAEAAVRRVMLEGDQ